MLVMQSHSLMNLIVNEFKVAPHFTAIMLGGKNDDLRFH